MCPGSRQPNVVPKVHAPCDSCFTSATAHGLLVASVDVAPSNSKSPSIFFVDTTVNNMLLCYCLVPSLIIYPGASPHRRPSHVATIVRCIIRVGIAARGGGPLLRPVHW